MLIPAITLSGFLGLLASLTVLSLSGQVLSSKAADVTGDPDDELLQQARIGTDQTSLLEFLRRRSPRGVDPQRLDHLIAQLGSPRFQDRERATHNLVALGPTVLQLLHRAESDADQERARRARYCIGAITRGCNSALMSAVVRKLVQRHLDGTVEALLGFLPYATYDRGLEEEVWFALDGLARDQGRTDPAFTAALRDAFPVRRAAAACIVGRRGDQQQRAAVRGLLADTDPLVRLRAAQGLLAARDKTVLPVLVALLDQPSVELAWQAEELLHYVAGEEAPEVTVGAGSARSRELCRKAWEAWWRRAGAKLDLDQLGREYRRPGLAFVTGSELANRGKVWRLSLYGCDSKPRWQLTGPSSGPQLWRGGAQLLPGARLLILGVPAGRAVNEPAPRSAEKGEYGVTECDLDGKIRWQYKWVYPPSFCQRLANGNTFLGNWRLRFVEVTPEGKAVYARDFSNRGGDLLSGRNPQRLRNGHLLCRVDRAEQGKSHVSLLEFDPDTGRTLRETPLPHGLMDEYYTIQRLPDGHYLLAGAVFGGIREVDGRGKTVWQGPAAGDATLLPSGNMLAVGYLAPGAGSVVEIDRAGKTVAEWITREEVWEVRAYLALIRLGFDPPRPALFDLTTSVPYRVRGLKSKDAHVRYASAWQLYELGPIAAPAVPALIEALNDSEEPVREEAKSALARVGPVAIPHLRSAAKDEHPHVRAAVAWIFGQFPAQAKAVVPPLVEAMNDENVVVRRKATWALGRIGPGAKPAVPALIEALKDTDVLIDNSDVTIPHAAATALASIGPDARAAVPALIEALKGGDRVLQLNAIYALGQIGPDARAAVLPLSAILQDTNADRSARQIVPTALAKIGPQAKAAVPVLQHALSDPDATIRSEAAKALQKIRP